MKTTYQLTAEHMVMRDGLKQALSDAQRFARSSPSREFWRYVFVCLERMKQTGG